MMSSMLEKTWEQTVSYLRGSSSIQLNTGINLKHLQHATIASSRSMHMQSYRNTINECIGNMRSKCQDMYLTLSEKRECLLIVIQLGNINEKLNFVHPFVIKCIADSKNVFDKVLGYTALGILNQSCRSSVYLAVNTILKDISNKNSAVSCISLTALASFIDIDLIPVFLSPVEKILKSGPSHVRYKALVVLHAMVRIGPEYVISAWSIMKHCLCDKDPQIMSGCLPIIETLLKTSKPPQDANIHGKIVFILKQVEQGRLPINMMHKGICGPWIQIRLIHIVRILSKENYNEQHLSDLEEIFSKIFARFQTAGYLQLAIIEECVRTIAALHPKVQKLENVMLAAIETALSSTDLNILLTGIEALKIIVKIKPGYSKQYTNLLLKNLSCGNKSLLEATMHLLEDLATAEDCQHIVSVLMENVQKVNNDKLRESILTGVLKLIEKFPMDEKWILEHYLYLLAFSDDSDISFAINKRVVMCFSCLSVETMQNEVVRLSKSLQERYTISQYCTILDILTFYHEKISIEDAKRTINDIMSNCQKNRWKPESYSNIFIRSLNCLSALSVHHNLKFDIKEEFPICPSMLQQHYIETYLLMQNSPLTKSILSIKLSALKEPNFDPNLSFLNDYSEKHEDSVSSSSEDESFKNQLSSSNNKVSISIRKKESEFLVKPYSKSRFDSSVLTIDEDKIKKNFLKNEAKASSSKTGNVWDKSRYKLDADGTEE
ncbi:AP-4 complex subunit epsilon-1-like [Styela clava]